MPTLVDVIDGREVRLDDGTLWRVGPSHVETIQEWRKGDPIAVSEDRRQTYFVGLVNERTGGGAQALPMRRP